MTIHPPSDGSPPPDLLRRLNEFQRRALLPERPSGSGVVPARAPLAGRDLYILARLRNVSSSLANSLEQALQDINDHTRLSYIGPAGEIREVMRAAVQLFAPDEEVKQQKWYVGIEQGGRRNPSQAERIRYAVQQRGGKKEQVKDIDTLIDQLIGQIGRQTYSTGSSALHAGTIRSKVQRLTNWVFAILDEILPD